MIGFQFVVPLIVGGVIGYITNDIAIRMLFRPHKAKYICGIHIPFTPGIIPKEKGRIAEALGGVISENFMNPEYLNRYLLSDEMVGKLRLSVSQFIEQQKVNEETLRQFLGHYLSEQEIAAIAESVNSSLTKQISAKLTDEAVGVKVANVAMEHVAGKLNSEGAQVLMAGLGGLAGGIGGLAGGIFGAPIITKFLGLLREPAENFLAKSINDMLKNNGDEIVSNMVNGEVDSFLDKRVCDLLNGHDTQLAQFVDTSENIYRTVITQHLPNILESIDISKVVRERINEMNVNETEKLIFQVMDKELKAIVWLGALLGFAMGCVNCLIL